jgi:hypothetical protein
MQAGIPFVFLLKTELFIRFYGIEFNEIQKERMISVLMKEKIYIIHKHHFKRN